MITRKTFPITRRWTSFAAFAALLLNAGSPLGGADAASTRDYLAPVPEQVYAGVPFDMPRVPVP
jgi:hypothetical protein